MGMAENYKHMYEQMKKMVALYQDEIVPGMREQLSKCVEVVRCKDCGHAHLTASNEAKYCDMWSLEDELYLPPDFWCAYGERKDDD